MPKGIYPRSERKAVPFVLVEKLNRQDETGRKVDALRIPLSRGKFSIVDTEMKHLENYRWTYRKYAGGEYAVRNIPECNNLFLHHAVVGRPLKGLVVDHINGNGLDNRLSNLRIVTRRENTHNQKRHREKGKIVGACWDKSKKRWVSCIRINGKQKFLGRFKTEKEAGDAYQNQRRLLWDSMT